MLLNAIGYTHLGCHVKLCKPLTLDICGKSRHAKTDILIITIPLNKLPDSLVLLIEKGEGLKDPAPKMIAQCVAVFNYNNDLREEAGHAPLEQKVIPAITLVGTAPTFYLVPVTSKLSKAIATGQYPQMTTYITQFQPKLDEFGMLSLTDRKHILCYYAAFKQFMDEMEEVVPPYKGLTESKYGEDEDKDKEGKNKGTLGEISTVHV
ncbi:hypothetical protein K439DRAFT_1338738 [Ramaria rubella]|nr:hypothetical protein K439DRAFT_1338738 [Ramaria rubella]